jgi:diacylglycerol kinase (ATP)
MVVGTAAIILVWSAEAFNTALEELADALHPERDPGIGRAKDVAAAAVLIAALGAAVIGMLVFVPHLVDWRR